MRGLCDQVNDRWHIYKDGRASGPFTSLEIREQLREGLIDPFDLVSRDGSTVRRELVEVDELFSSSKIVYEGAEQFGQNKGRNVEKTVPGMRVSGDALTATGGGFIPDLRSVPVAKSNARSDSGQDHAVDSGPRAPFMALADSGAVASAEERSLPGNSRKKSGKPRSRKEPKLFNLIDAKGRVLGPLSASEIQTTFHKGVLASSVQVVKIGSTTQVPVGRFVAIYMQNGGAVAARAARPVVPAAASRPVARAKKEAAPTVLIAIILFVAMGLFSAAGFIFYRNSHANGGAARRSTVTQSPKPTPIPAKGPLPRPNQAASPAAKSAAPARAQNMQIRSPAEVAPVATVRTTPAIGDLRKQRAAALAQRRAAALAQKRTAILAARKQHAAQAALAAARKKPSAPPATIAKLNAKTAPPKPAAKPVARAVLKPIAKPAPPAGPTVAGLTDGQPVNGLGPMSFDRQAVEACDGPCSITFTGAGGTVTGRFFKAAFGAGLLGKQGGVYVSGLVRKSGGGVTILINGVR